MDKKTYIQMRLIKNKPLKVLSSGVIVEDNKKYKKKKDNKTGYYNAGKNRQIQRQQIIHNSGI